jgi:hypothetical protein
VLLAKRNLPSLAQGNGSKSFELLKTKTSDPTRIQISYDLESNALVSMKTIIWLPYRISQTLIRKPIQNLNCIMKFVPDEMEQVNLDAPFHGSGRTS